MDDGNDKVYLSLKELQLLTNWATLAPLAWRRKQYFSVRSYQNTNRRLFLSKMLVSISKRFDSLGQIFFKLVDTFDGTVELRLDIRIIAVGDGNVEVMLKWSFKCFKQIDLNPPQSSRPAQADWCWVVWETIAGVRFGLPSHCSLFSVTIRMMTSTSALLGGSWLDLILWKIYQTDSWREMFASLPLHLISLTTTTTVCFTGLTTTTTVCVRKREHARW